MGSARLQPCYDFPVAFSRWDPFRDLLALHDQIGQLVGSDAPGWTPPVDLYETAQAFTDWPAIFVKSGPVVMVPLTAGAGAGAGAAARCGSASGAVVVISATESLAMRMRPVTTMPAANPATTRTKVRRRRRIMRR